MTGALAGFVIAFVTGLICTRLTIPLANRMGVVDQPDKYRKVHNCDMPLLGGLPVFVATFLPLLLLYLFYRDHAVIQAFAESRSCPAVCLVLGSLIAFGLGVVDDVFDVRVRYKLLLQLVAAFAAFSYGLGISAISLPFVGSVSLGWFAFPVTVLWFLGCMNAINLVDGLDGLAGGVSLFVVLTMALIALLHQQFVNLFLLSCAGGAICGFLYFNFHPAKIFLGDSGSMLIGFLIAALSLQGTAKAETAAVALLIPTIAMGVPIMDTSMAIIRRWSRGLPISAPDRHHLHHRLLSYGLSHQRAVLVIYGICVLFGFAAVVTAIGGDETGLFVLGIIGILGTVSARVIGGVHFADPFTRLTRELAQRTHSKDAKIAVERAAHRMPRCESLDEIWNEVRIVSEELHVDHVRLHVNGLTGVESTFEWSAPWADPHCLDEMRPETWTAFLELRINGQDSGKLLVRRSMTREGHLQELPNMLLRLRALLAQELHRVTRH